MPPRRRHVLAAALAAPLAGLGAGGSAGAGGLRPAQALPARTLVFPRDHGSHPDLRTEWWYVTGRLEDTDGRPFGFQVTFFRSRVDGTESLASKFAARQLVFAHAALTDVRGRRLRHDQRIAREGFGIAAASLQDADLRLRDWSLRRGNAKGHPDAAAAAWQAEIAAADFRLTLSCTPTQPVLLQGAQGLSRKGPDPAQASYYYSLPQLRVEGHLSLDGGAARPVRGRAWLDHEWSEALLHPQAVGWDWIGMNLHDGSALTAFRLRRRDGSPLWDGGSFRAASGGSLYVFSPGETQFSPQRRWKSPLTQASYPVEWLVRTPADIYTVRAVLDDQELDSRASTGGVYWEGLADLIDSNGRPVGQGYLEMTGYAQPLRM